MVTGINHLTLSVRNTQESFDFYTKVLGLKPLARWTKGAYLAAGDFWIVLVEDKKTRESSLPEYTHVAFSVQHEEFDALSESIKRSGAEIWQENRSEGPSLYFLDPNGHKLEIHVGDIQTRLMSVRANPWEGLEFFSRRKDSTGS
jgi:catechol 2,3-dioxygenase-like lactoylglutathione lyase family enzyme